MKDIVCSGRIDAGKLGVRNARKYHEALKAAGTVEVIVTIAKAHATRSKAQNDYYYAVIVARVAAKWNKPAGLTHELLKAQFLPHDMAAKGLNGTLINGLIIGGSTTKLNKLQFIEYLETIVGWAAEKWDLYLPDPDPLWREHAEAERHMEAAS